LGIPHWYNHAVQIKAYADEDRNHGGNKDGRVDLKDKVNESPEEEYERDVDKPGDELGDLWQALSAFEQKLSNSGSFQRFSGLLEDAHIGPSPLLNQRCEKGGRQTAYEANDPGNIYSAVRRRCMKDRVGQWGSIIGWDLAVQRGELLRHSVKHMNCLILVIG
jgi:hypothetical protein